MTETSGGQGRFSKLFRRNTEVTGQQKDSGVQRSDHWDGATKTFRVETTRPLDLDSLGNIVVKLFSGNVVLQGTEGLPSVSTSVAYKADSEATARQYTPEDLTFDEIPDGFRIEGGNPGEEVQTIKGSVITGDIAPGGRVTGLSIGDFGSGTISSHIVAGDIGPGAKVTGVSIGGTEDISSSGTVQEKGGLQRTVTIKVPKDKIIDYVLVAPAGVTGHDVSGKFDVNAVKGDITIDGITLSDTKSLFDGKDVTLSVRNDSFAMAAEVGWGRTAEFPEGAIEDGWSEDDKRMAHVGENPTTQLAVTSTGRVKITHA